jgi:hypothetical protein
LEFFVKGKNIIRGFFAPEDGQQGQEAFYGGEGDQQMALG